MNDKAYYKKIGFMCGLEIHQRLATAEKLFCSCSALSSPSKQSKTSTKEIYRYQRAVAGEMGKVDIAAEFEEIRRRKFSYNVSEDSCLVEIDEEPPHEVNLEALTIALSYAKAMDMHLADEIQPMRKEVVDGSDPSAFQRSMLIGLEGAIVVNGKKIGITSLYLEEESSRPKNSQNRSESSSISYDIDKLGVPLIEIDTDPVIETPEEAKIAALHMGTILRISGNVQRGIGSIRQDVNISIKDGARVEIKGLQDIDVVDKFIENEITRQQKLIAIKDKLVQRHAMVYEAKDITAILKDTKSKIISTNIKSEGIVLGFRLRAFKAIVGEEINPNIRLGSEISEYAKMAGVKGLIHSDENLAKYEISENEITKVKKELAIADTDAFILIAAPKFQALKAAELAIMRAKMAIEEPVPKETRIALNDGTFTTRFARPLAGGARMYPETDASPILVTKALMDKASKIMPDIEKEKTYLKSKLKIDSLVDAMIVSTKLQLFKRIISSTKCDPAFVANILLQKFTELRREGMGPEAIKETRLIELFDDYTNNKITTNGFYQLLKILSTTDSPLEILIKQNSLGVMSRNDIKSIVTNELKERKIKTKRDLDILRADIMAQHKNRIDGGLLNEILQELSKNIDDKHGGNK